MPLDAQATRSLLRALDDPDHLEHPRDHDHRAARACFDRLATAVAGRFGCSCAVDRHVQDASHHGVIVVPAAATASGEHITITVSNFGKLAAVTLGTPGTYDEQEEHDLFHHDDRRRVEDELIALGYHPLSEHHLWDPYDGPAHLARHPTDRPTWWTRYFDYL